MTDDLHQRAQMLFDRFKAFPDAGKQGAFFLVREDAFMAFLDMRQLLEREILPALHQLEATQSTSGQAPVAADRSSP